MYYLLSVKSFLTNRNRKRQDLYKALSSPFQHQLLIVVIVVCAVVCAVLAVLLIVVRIAVVCAVRTL